MSLIVRVVTRWLLGLVLVFGLGVAFFGHLTPGGGFAGGVVIACGFVMATLAFGGQTGPGAWMARLAPSLDATGASLYVATGALGYVAGHFLHQWAALGEPFTLGSTPCLVIINLAILLKVGAGLFAGFVALVWFGRLGEDVPEKGADA
jgi:multicomponent Na+:H+ antiporter subunit B